MDHDNQYLDRDLKWEQEICISRIYTRINLIDLNFIIHMCLYIYIYIYVLHLPLGFSEVIVLIEVDVVSMSLDGFNTIKFKVNFIKVSKDFPA
jgi:hypothetical protein